MKLSIIIVNYKAWVYLEKALDSLHDQFPDEWELIIVDNESEPTAFNEFRQQHQWVKLIAVSENCGFGFGCRIGVAHASGDQYLFMNPDVVATCDEIRALITEKKAHPDVGILSPKQVDLSGRPQKVFDEFPDLINQSKLLKYIRRALNPSRKPDPRAQHDSLVYCDWVTGSFLLIDRADYDSIGGWSSDYWMYVEDADLCKRAHDAGLKVAYAPKVQIVHIHGGSSRINVSVKAKTKLEVIISKHVYVQKHLRGTSRWLSHLLIAMLRLPSLAIAAVADLVTLRRNPTLRVRSKILGSLLSYYRNAVSSRTWLSPRARENKARHA